MRLTFALEGSPDEIEDFLLDIAADSVPPGEICSGDIADRNDDELRAAATAHLPL